MPKKKKGGIKSWLRAGLVAGAWKANVGAAIGKRLLGPKKYKAGKVYPLSAIHRVSKAEKEARKSVREGVKPKKATPKKKETMAERVKRLREEEAKRLREATE